jgi:hypothetical protein
MCSTRPELATLPHNWQQMVPPDSTLEAWLCGMPSLSGQDTEHKEQDNLEAASRS